MAPPSAEKARHADAENVPPPANNATCAAPAACKPRSPVPSAAPAPANGAKTPQLACGRALRKRERRKTAHFDAAALEAAANEEAGSDTEAAGKDDDPTFEPAAKPAATRKRERRKTVHFDDEQSLVALAAAEVEAEQAAAPQAQAQESQAPAPAPAPAVEDARTPSPAATPLDAPPGLSQGPPTAVKELLEAADRMLPSAEPSPEAAGDEDNVTLHEQLKESWGGASYYQRLQATIAGGASPLECKDVTAPAALSTNPLFAFGHAASSARPATATDEVADAEAARKARVNRRKSRKSVGGALLAGQWQGQSLLEPSSELASCLARLSPAPQPKAAARTAEPAPEVTLEALIAGPSQRVVTPKAKVERAPAPKAAPKTTPKAGPKAAPAASPKVVTKATAPKAEPKRTSARSAPKVEAARPTRVAAKAAVLPAAAPEPAPEPESALSAAVTAGTEAKQEVAVLRAKLANAESDASAAAERHAAELSGVCDELKDAQAATKAAERRATAAEKKVGAAEKRTGAAEGRADAAEGAVAELREELAALKAAMRQRAETLRAFAGEIDAVL